MPHRIALGERAVVHLGGCALDRSKSQLALRIGRSKRPLCPRVERLETRLDALQVGLVGYQVDLIEQEPVRQCHLPHGLILDAGGLLLVQMAFDVRRIDECHNRVESCESPNVLINEEGLGDGCRIS